MVRKEAGGSWWDLEAMARCLVSFQGQQEVTGSSGLWQAQRHCVHHRGLEEAVMTRCWPAGQFDGGTLREAVRLYLCTQIQIQKGHQPRVRCFRMWWRGEIVVLESRRTNILKCSQNGKRFEGHSETCGHECKVIPASMVKRLLEPGTAAPENGELAPSVSQALASYR